MRQRGGRAAFPIAVALLLAARSATAQDPAAGAAPVAVAAAPFAEVAGDPAWVRPEAKVNFRSAPSPGAVALGIVKTGDEVRITERRSGWARVQLADRSGGWVPESYLETDPPPLQKIAALESEAAALRDRLTSAERELETLRARNVELEGEQDEREGVMRRLTDENRDLRAGERWPYLVTGASILGAGMLVGALVARSSARRSGPRIRF